MARNVVERFLIGITFIIFSLFSWQELILSSNKEIVYKYNQSGIEKLKNKDFRGAINDFKMAHFYDPSNKKILNNLVIAYNNYGFYLMKKGEFTQAIEKYEQALYYDPHRPYVLYNLGQAYYMNQNISKAKLVLEKAYKLAPNIKGLKRLLDKVNREVEVEKGLTRLETMHFIVVSSQNIPIEKISYIRTYLEEAYGRVGMFLDHYLTKKVVAVLYSEAEYDKLLGNKPHWTMAIFDGKVRIPVSKFKYSNEEVVRFIYHEYAHAVVRDITKGNCPLWLNEGIACKAEDFVTPHRGERFAAYFEKFGVVPLKKIPNNFTQIRDVRLATLMYGESYLLVEFILREVGQSGLREILRYLGQKVPITVAIQKVLGRDYNSFARQWEEYVRRKYGIYAR